MSNGRVSAVKVSSEPFHILDRFSAHVRGANWGPACARLRAWQPAPGPVHRGM